MAVLLFCISHKSAPVEIREKFSFDDEQKLELLRKMTLEREISEAVVLATCNRTEIYAVTEDGEDTAKAFQLITSHVLSQAGADYIPKIDDYIFFYQDEKAVHHLFLVTAGLDSVILGEDQILGQVKQAHDFSKAARMCGPVLNTLFQNAVTAAKKIKTETSLSKSSVSYGTLALKIAEEKLGTLRGRKILVIGASGKMGGIVFKNAISLKDVEVTATRRLHTVYAEPSACTEYHIIPYADRYTKINDADVIISATSSPHYTITKDHILTDCLISRPQVYVDLAVPMDIDPKVATLPDTWYFNLEDLKRLAAENNRRKQEDLPAADEIIQSYETEFSRRFLFQKYLPDIRQAKQFMAAEALTCGWEKAVDHFFYHMRDAGDREEVESFFRLIVRMNEEQEQA